MTTPQAPAAPSPEALEALSRRLRSALHPAMLQPPYDQGWSEENPTFGFCSIASEAAWFLLGGKPAGWVAHCAREQDGSTHWWLKHASGVVFDPTVDQYHRVGRLAPYERGVPGRATGFMGVRKDPENVWGTERRPGLRAQALLESMGAIAPQAAPSGPSRSRWKP